MIILILLIILIFLIIFILSYMGVGYYTAFTEVKDELKDAIKILKKKF